MTFEKSSKTAYETWTELFGDEELYRAVLKNEHRALAEAKGLTPEQIAILDDFAAERGTRWNVDNLYYRSASECGAVLRAYMPRTIKLLTGGGNIDWLQDITYEYLSSHHWRSLGQRRMAECERFIAYIHDRIAKRRRLPLHFDSALKLEQSLVELIKSTASLSPEAWITPIPEDLEPARLTRGPAVRVVDLDDDISDWIHSVDPTKGEVRPGPISVMILIPSPTESHKFQKISEGTKYLFELFDGEATVDEIAEHMEEEGIARPTTLDFVKRWTKERALVSAT